jgi:hypothetical protein
MICSKCGIERKEDVFFGGKKLKPCGLFDGTKYIISGDARIVGCPLDIEQKSREYLANAGKAMADKMLETLIRAHEDK